MSGLNDPRRRRKVPLPRDIPRQCLPKAAVDGAVTGSDEMERRLNAALANALDAEISNHLKGEVRSDLMPQEISANAPKAGRRKSISVDRDDTCEDDNGQSHARRGSGALSSRSCGNQFPTASESELMSSLMRRLTEAERELKQLKSEVAHKNATIEDLQSKNAALKQQVARAPSQIVVKRMELDNRKLANTVREMQQFLSDYGLTWVGENPQHEQMSQQEAELTNATVEQTQGPAHEQEQEQVQQKCAEGNPSLWLPEKSLPTSPKSESVFEFDMKVLQARIAELNVVAGEGTSDVEKTKQGEFKLKKRDPLELAFWKNGFQINGAPLRSYKVAINRAFVQDILDGYFPYELKEKYPDGVPFTVLDQSFEHHHRPFSQAGRGRQLCGHKVGHSVADVIASDAQTKANAQPKDVDSFLAKLPKNVIRNGKIIPVRAGVEELIKPQPTTEPTVVHLNTVDQEGVKAQDNDKTTEKVATLQIKCTHTNKTFVVRFPYSATIAQVLWHLSQQGEMQAQCEKDGVLPQYRLQTSFPKKILDDPSLTLENAGLVPNSALVLIKT